MIADSNKVDQIVDQIKALSNADKYKLSLSLSNILPVSAIDEIEDILFVMHNNKIYKVKCINYDDSFNSNPDSFYNDYIILFKIESTDCTLVDGPCLCIDDNVTFTEGDIYKNVIMGSLIRENEILIWLKTKEL